MANSQKDSPTNITPATTASSETDLAVSGSKPEPTKPEPTKEEPPQKQKATSKSAPKPVASPKPKRPQSVLFLISESAVSLASTINHKVIKQLPLDDELKTPTISSSEFRTNIERFFVRKSKKKPGPTSFSDAQLLLFPLRSMRGVFTWVTSLQQLKAFDAHLKDTTCAPRWPLVGLDETKILSGPHNACMVKEHVALEEYNFSVSIETRVQGISRWLAANALAQGQEYQWWRAKLARDLLIVPHELFVQLVGQNLPTFSYTSGDSLYNEETLPKESVFYSILDDAFAEAELELNLSTVGKMQNCGMGICNFQLLTRANNKVKRSKKKTKTSSNQSNQAGKKPEANTKTVGKEQLLGEKLENPPTEDKATETPVIPEAQAKAAHDE